MATKKAKGSEGEAGSGAAAKKAASKKAATKKASAKKTATKKAAKKASPASPTVTALVLSWGVYNQNMKRVAVFRAHERKEAEKKARELTKSTETPHFVERIKEAVVPS